MVAKQENIVICPSCGAENIEGVDNCERCLSDLRSIDVLGNARAHVGGRWHPEPPLRSQ